MTTRPAKSVRKPRADALRNRELLLEAATQIFLTGGPQASLEAVAQKAGVGIGTLYRHFPTREDLFEAVYRHEVDGLFALAQKLVVKGDAVKGDSVGAIRKWLHANVKLAATKKGMIEALQLGALGSSDLKAYSFERLTTALELLLERAVADGSIRGDIRAEDMLRALVGIFYSQAAGDWRQSTLRLVDVFVDGLRKG